MSGMRADGLGQTDGEDIVGAVGHPVPRSSDQDARTIPTPVRTRSRDLGKPFSSAPITGRLSSELRPNGWS